MYNGAQDMTSWTESQLLKIFLLLRIDLHLMAVLVSSKGEDCNVLKKHKDILDSDALSNETTTFEEILDNENLFN